MLAEVCYDRVRSKEAWRAAEVLRRAERNLGPPRELEEVAGGIYADAPGSSRSRAFRRTCEGGGARVSGSAAGGARSGPTYMVTLLQKIWRRDGSVQVQAFEANSLDAAMRMAYQALDVEIARDLEEHGQITVERALCDDRELVERIP